MFLLIIIDQTHNISLGLSLFLGVHFPQISVQTIKALYQLHCRSNYHNTFLADQIAVESLNKTDNRKFEQSLRPSKILLRKFQQQPKNCPTPFLSHNQIWLQSFLFYNTHILQWLFKYHRCYVFLSIFQVDSSIIHNRFFDPVLLYSHS